jgi:hypothetical protein
MIADLETAVDLVFDHLRECGSLVADRRRPGLNSSAQSAAETAFNSAGFDAAGKYRESK